MMDQEFQVKVHLMRHGEVDNPRRIVYGRIPNYHLTDRGRAMVRLSAEDFKDRAQAGANFVHLVCSPLTRTRESAEPIAELLGLHAHPDTRVIEAANHFEGLHVSSREILAHPRHWVRLYNPFRPSWGEPYAHQARRMAAAIRAAAKVAYEKAGPQAEAIVVSHQLPIWVARRSAQGRVLPHDPRSRQCRLASVTTFEFDDLEFCRPVRVGYREPAASLYSGVIQLPGT